MKYSIITLVTLVSLLLFLTVAGKSQSAVPSGNYIELLGGYTSAVTQSSVVPSGVTIEGWINPTTTEGKQPILSIGENGISRYEIGINGGSLSLSYRFGQGSQRIITSGFLEENAWQHLAVAIGSTKTVLFINGAPVYTLVTSATTLLPPGSTIRIGASVAGGAERFKGTADEFRISTSTRDVAALWAGGSYQTPFTPDQFTFALWHFDEPRGQTIATDASVNSYNAALVGTDSNIHFHGILPTSTPKLFPTIRFLRPTLPTLQPLPFIVTPTPFITSILPIPTPTESIFSRPSRPPHPTRPFGR